MNTSSNIRTNLWQEPPTEMAVGTFSKTLFKKSSKKEVVRGIVVANSNEKTWGGRVRGGKKEKEETDYPIIKLILIFVLEGKLKLERREWAKKNNN